MKTFLLQSAPVSPTCINISSIFTFFYWIHISMKRKLIIKQRIFMVHVLNESAVHAKIIVTGKKVLELYAQLFSKLLLLLYYYYYHTVYIQFSLIN